MEDYPEIPGLADRAAYALERVLERCSSEVHWHYRRMTAAQLAREFAKALNAVSEQGSIADFEEQFRRQGTGAPRI